MNKLIEEFLKHLAFQNGPETEDGYHRGLKQFDAWLVRRELEPAQVTLAHLQSFQRWLADEYRSPGGEPLARSTQATRLAAVKGLYKYLAMRGVLVVDPSRKIQLPRVKRRVTQRDYLSLQEATALLQTQASLVKKEREGSQRWAMRQRDLALLCVALATGRRRSGLLSLRTDDLNFRRSEIRFEFEKGKAGRVVPVAIWAMEQALVYVEKARPILRHSNGSSYLFVSERGERFSRDGMRRLLRVIHRATVEANPDLVGLASKNLTPHSLRVTTMKLLSEGGMKLRTLNEIMDHEKLETTARYLPLQLEELRRVSNLAHPRP